MRVNHKILIIFAGLMGSVWLMFHLHSWTWVLLSFLLIGSLYFVTNDKLKLAIIAPIGLIISAVSLFIYINTEQVDCGNISSQIKDEEVALAKIKNDIQVEENKEPFYQFFWDSPELDRLQIEEDGIQDKLNKQTRKKAVCTPNNK